VRKREDGEGRKEEGGWRGTEVRSSGKDTGKE
jgi:hypothetical protein